MGEMLLVTVVAVGAMVAALEVKTGLEIGILKLNHSVSCHIHHNCKPKSPLVALPKDPPHAP